MTSPYLPPLSPPLTDEQMRKYHQIYDKPKSFQSLPFEKMYPGTTFAMNNGFCDDDIDDNGDVTIRFDPIKEEEREEVNSRGASPGESLDAPSATDNTAQECFEVECDELRLDMKPI